MPPIRERKTPNLLCRLAVVLLALALIFATAVPFFHGNAWWIRVFDFPRLQIALLMALTLAGYAALRLYGPLRRWEYALAVVVGLGLGWQLYAIVPYTVFYPSQMAASDAKDDANRLSLLVFNVLEDNREVEALRDLIRETDPDIILLCETTPWWLEQLDGLEDAYPYTLLQPQENHYGMLLYSRLELQNREIRFLIEPGVPSIRSEVLLRSGATVTLYGVHPRPPGLATPDQQNDGVGKDDESERESSAMRDAELLSVAREVKALGDAPVIVAGDFNDVAWSRTTHLFQRIGGLLDPRVGRGLFNSFDARSRLLRFPLDHVFASRHFLLVEIRRLRAIGSDHFPMLVILDHDRQSSVANEVPQPDAGDAQKADEAIDTGKFDD